MREENNILGMIDMDGFLEPKLSCTTSSLLRHEGYVDVYNKELISVAEMLDMLDVMDFSLVVKEINHDEEYILLGLVDIQDYSSSMNDLEFEINIKDEETIRRDMYEILIGNFENHLEDYGYDFE